MSDDAALNPDMGAWELFELYREVADTHPTVKAGVAYLLGGIDNQAFRDASTLQLNGVRSLLEAVMEAWSAGHGILFEDTPGVIKELNRLRYRTEAKRIYDAEQAADEDYGSLYLMRPDLVDMTRGEPIIDGVLDRHTLAVVAGRDQSYKSFLVLDWLLCLATGTPWQGHQVERTQVLYVIGEGAWGLDARVTAWEQHHSIEVPHTWFIVRRAPVNLFRGGADLEELLQHIANATHGIGLVAFDTLRRCSAGANLNLEADAGVVISNLDRVRDATDNGSVAYVAHTDKADNDTRGSGALEDDADIVWRAKRDDETGAVRFRLAKRKDGPDGLTHTLRPRTIAGSLVLDEQLSGLTEAVPKQVHPIVQLLGTPVFEDGASVTALAQALGLSGYGSVTSALNWLIKEGRATKAKSGRTAIYTLKTGAETTSSSAGVRGKSTELPQAGTTPLPAQTDSSADLPRFFRDEASTSAVPSMPLGMEAEGNGSGTRNDTTHVSAEEEKREPHCAVCHGPARTHDGALHAFTTDETQP
jgi:AAA domain